MKQNSFISEDLDFAGLDRMREHYGVSQAALCQRMGINNSTYCRWKRRILVEGQDWSPKTYSMIALRHALSSLIGEKVRTLDRHPAAAE